MCPGVNSASKNEYQEFSWGEGGRCVELTTNHPSSAECREIRGLNLPGPPRALGGLLREYLYLIYMYVLASKCCCDHFRWEKYKTVQSFKLHFLQNSSLVQLYASASDCQCVRNIPGSHFVKAYLALLPPAYVVASQKCHPLSADFS
jgi:hypothetical protein